MSWSIQKLIGTPDKVREAVIPLFDANAKMYAGKPEADDVLAAKASVLAFLNGVAPGMVAIVEASGSRGERWLTIKVDCSSLNLLV